MTRPLVAAALAALLAIPLHPAAADADGRTGMELDLKVQALGGGLDGEGVRPVSGGVAVVRASAHPVLRGEGWRLEFPLRLAHRQTFGFDLQETKGALDVEPWIRATRNLRLGLAAGILGANRPDWPDLYQRDPATGALTPTDRYSYFAWRAGLEAYARPAAHQHLRGRYRFASYDYGTDPNFGRADPLTGQIDLMHITPRDRTQHKVDLSWRYLRTAWALALRLDYAHREYKDLFARNARSGATPQDPVTGAELNPKQKLDKYEPSAEVELKHLGGKLELTFRYGVEVQNDPFQGYYSYTGHHPRVQARLAMGDRLAASASVEGWYRTYGADGSTRVEQAGDRRTDSRAALEGALEYGLGAGLSLRGEVAWVSRSTNYRDYVPPASSFDIDFDYTNFLALAGLAYRL